MIHDTISLRIWGFGWKRWTYSMKITTSLHHIFYITSMNFLEDPSVLPFQGTHIRLNKQKFWCGARNSTLHIRYGFSCSPIPNRLWFGYRLCVILSQPKLDSDNRRCGIIITFETAKKTANHVKQNFMSSNGVLENMSRIFE